MALAPRGRQLVHPFDDGLGAIDRNARVVMADDGAALAFLMFGEENALDCHCLGIMSRA